MRPSTASIRRFHFSVVIVSQLADQQAAVRCRLLADSVAKVPKSVRPIFREKTKQAATVHRCSFRTTTEVAGELDIKMMWSPTPLFGRHAWSSENLCPTLRKEFATLSARSGHPV